MLPIFVLTVTTQGTESSILPGSAVARDRDPAVSYLLIESVPGVFVVKDWLVFLPRFAFWLLLHEHFLGALADRLSGNIFFHRGD